MLFRSSAVAYEIRDGSLVKTLARQVFSHAVFRRNFFSCPFREAVSHFSHRKMRSSAPVFPAADSPPIFGPAGAQRLHTAVGFKLNPCSCAAHFVFQLSTSLAAGIDIVNAYFKRNFTRLSRRQRSFNQRAVLRLPVFSDKPVAVWSDVRPFGLADAPPFRYVAVKSLINAWRGLFLRRQTQVTDSDILFFDAVDQVQTAIRCLRIVFADASHILPAWIFVMPAIARR